MAVMSYKEWLAARSRRTGQPVMSSPAEAAAFKNWQAQQPEYQAQQQLDQGLYGANPADPAAGGSSTSLNSDDLWNAILKDPSALQDAALAQQDYTVGGKTSLANWQNARAQLAAQLPQLALQQEQGIRAADSRTAARGTAQSGQGELEKQQVRADYANAITQNELANQQADNEYQTNATNLASDFNNRYYGAFKDAATRYVQGRMDDFNNTYGINSGLGTQVPTQAAVDAQTPKPPAIVKPQVPKPTTPTPSWAQFVASHGSPTGAQRTRLSGLYKKRFA